MTNVKSTAFICEIYSFFLHIQGNYRITKKATEYNNCTLLERNLFSKA